MLPDDFPGAAGKYVLDSEVLLAASRFDGAGYLAGYAVECTIKTVAQVEGQDPHGHDLNVLSRKALELAALPTQRTARYLKDPNLTTLSYGDLPGWRHTLRYQPDGFVGEANSRVWVAEARRLYEDVIVRMRIDGVLK